MAGLLLALLAPTACASSQEDRARASSDAATELDAARADDAATDGAPEVDDANCSVEDGGTACNAPASSCTGKCAPSDWATARRTCAGFAGPFPQSTVQPIIMRCGAYDRLSIGNLDDYRVLYYEHPTGRLAAVIGLTTHCDYGPPCFIEPRDCDQSTNCVPETDAQAGSADAAAE
jgi:hypothetical protein